MELTVDHQDDNHEVQRSTPDSRPVQAGIFNRNGTTPFCGGAVIDDRHILTAAHCFVRRGLHLDFWTAVLQNLIQIYGFGVGPHCGLLDGYPPKLGQIGLGVKTHLDFWTAILQNLIQINVLVGRPLGLLDGYPPKLDTNLRFWCKDYIWTLDHYPPNLIQINGFLLNTLFGFRTAVSKT
ncbi:hypothetical protein AVEN_232488-1 [Araneus ventricosus]|uniref:Peptidase S1 domain-containing protein n=1 Tax=Araneus ventricosus TaxID=182803 RepID=A0A4Y2A4F7_ARAVE|nr:hypothetical protein AVEN_232488-1 [Araneus ventricosus]